MFQNDCTVFGGERPIRIEGYQKLVVCYLLQPLDNNSYPLANKILAVAPTRCKREGLPWIGSPHLVDW